MKDKNIEQVEYQSELFNNDDAFDVRPRNRIIKRNSGRNGGRKKGSLNERTKRMLEAIDYVIESVPPEQIKLDQTNMTPYERNKSLIQWHELRLKYIMRAEIVNALDENEVVVCLPTQIDEIIHLFEEKSVNLGEDKEE